MIVLTVIFIKDAIKEVEFYGVGNYYRNCILLGRAENM